MHTNFPAKDTLEYMYLSFHAKDTLEHNNICIQVFTQRITEKLLSQLISEYLFFTTETQIQIYL